MQAARLHELAGLPHLDEVSEPDAETLPVTSSALNPIDVAIGSGRFYGGVPETPYVIGSEAVVRGSDGRRYWYYGRATVAERVAAGGGQLVEIPEGVGDDVALACGIAGLTGWL